MMSKGANSAINSVQAEPQNSAGITSNVVHHLVQGSTCTMCVMSPMVHVHIGGNISVISTWNIGAILARCLF